MNISTHIISQILHGPVFVLPANTAEIDFRVKEIKKVKVKQIGSEDKLVQLQKMDRITATDQEDVPWVVGSAVGSSLIKNILNFQDKA